MSLRLQIKIMITVESIKHTRAPSLHDIANISLCDLKLISLTSDCQNADPPTAASKYMIIMKICTSVTSMLDGKERKKQPRHLTVNFDLCLKHSTGQDAEKVIK